VFILGAPLLIGYSKGYRLDDALELIQTGGIYLHSDVANTNVYIDDVFIEKNGQFLRNTFVQTLLPNRTHKVVVQKEGLQDWRKDLMVLPDLVTEANVIMLPREFEWRMIPATSTLPVSGPASALVSASSSVPNPEYVSLTEEFAQDLDQFEVEVASTTVVLVKGKPVATTTTLVEVQYPSWLAPIASTTGFADEDMVREREGMALWLHDGNVHAVWVRPSDPPPFYFCVKECVRELVIDWKEPIRRYDFFPNRNDVVVVASDQGIYAVELDDRSQRNIQVIRAGLGLDFRLNGDEIVVFDGATYWETRL
jgi:hypothetical protein